MSRRKAADDAADEDLLSPTRLDGLLQLAYAPERVQPARRSRAQLADLSARELALYHDARNVWHANIGPLKTPQLVDLHEHLDEIVGSNRQQGGKAKPGALVDAYAGTGKTTAVLDFACEYFREQVRLRGETTSHGHRRVPVIYISLTGNTQIRGLNASICRFYKLPTRGDADTLAERAVDAVRSMGTRVFVVDDIHFLASGTTNTARMVNQLKFLSNTFPVTFIHVGVGVKDRGILNEGRSLAEWLHAQFGRRTTLLTLAPFQVDDDQGRYEFRRVLLTIEKKLVLAEKYPGMLADDLADYFWTRTSGHFASLMTLVNRGCYRAIRTGRERLDEDLLNQVKNDAAAEAARLELKAALDAGSLTARPQSLVIARKSA
jgi:hypothetical protein